jgi:RNA polymerase sigma-70 factor, ECF subfamily
MDEDLGAVFARLRQSLGSYLRKRTHDAALADDLVQEVFVKALTAHQAGRRIENLTGWLYAAARTTLIDHHRAAGAPTQALDDAIPMAEADDTMLHQELALCLRPFVERLAPLYRDTLIAVEYEGRTMQSVAEAQGVSVSAIKSRASRARALLKERVLACCRVEFADGLVSDYQRVSRSPCDCKCGNAG